MREYGSEHPAVILSDGYFESLESLGREITYLRSGREALLLTALKCKQGIKAPTILFPAYCCWSMSAPFEKAGWIVVYYRLNEDLTVDLDYLKDLLDKVKVDAILTMNFYGSARTDDAVAMVKSANKEIAVIEDFSHCTFSIKQIHNEQVDVYVSSIRKSIGVCDGALILSHLPMPMEYVKECLPEFCDRRYRAQTQKRDYLFSKNSDTKQMFLGEIRKCEEILNAFTDIHHISKTALRMISSLNGEHIAYARIENMRHLMQRLYGKVRIVPGVERCLGGAPFSLPILVENRDQIQQMLAKAGVYAPVLWPICNEARKICRVSALMSDQMLSIPIDQRYDWDDMEEIAERIIKTINN